ncbi:hypothetical protein OG871_06850 [Kitasatospora sp. NBC_00374]|uniref:hypothetical protein n=1 Tax=Kitasatospora sp. NBC_00374 TaxID=2975964 RepID=UPI0030E28392
MQIMRRPARAAARAAVLATATLAATQFLNISAQAADGDGIAGYQSAQQVLQSGQVKDTVSRFLVAARQAGTPAAADGGTVGTPGNAPGAVAAPPRFDLKDPVPMFELSPEFVAGKSQASPQTALRLSYLAARVTASDGHQAAVLLAPQNNGQSNAAPDKNGVQNIGAEGWQLAGIRDGDAEVSLAERGTAQARTFTEPQIHAWYRLTAEGMVEPLNDEATTGLQGKAGIPLADYQKLVNTRYGDKLPGSEYDRKGLAGGFAGLTDGQPQQVTTTAAEPTADPDWRPAAITGVAALAAIAGATWYQRRRRTSTTR